MTSRPTWCVSLLKIHGCLLSCSTTVSMGLTGLGRALVCHQRDHAGVLAGTKELEDANEIVATAEAESAS